MSEPQDQAIETEIPQSNLRLSEDDINRISQKVTDFIRNHPPVEIDFAGRQVLAKYEEPIDLMTYRSSIPPELGKRFDAHGIANNSYKSDLVALNKLLSSGVEKGRTLYTTQLRLTDEQELQGSALGSVGPFDTGSFIVVGPPDQKINQAGIKGVIVNDHFYEVIPELQQAFPEVKFIPAKDLPQGLNQLLN